MWKITILLAFVCLATSIATAEKPFDPNFIAGLKQMAEQGDPNTQFRLGLIYHVGHGVAQNHEEAIKWYKRAAEQGHVIAQYDLGVLYEASKDYMNAFLWYKKAAEQNFAAAQFNLGEIYRKGQGVARDSQEGLKWYRKAAEQGHVEAQFSLGITYENLTGATHDYQEAVKWYKKAAEQGHADAQNSLGTMYAGGRGVAKDYHEAVEWYKKAAEQGNFSGQSNLSKMYYYGEGVTEDYVEAYKWLIIAAAQLQFQGITELRDEMKQKMSPQQIGESQRLAREFKPVISPHQKDTDMAIQQRYKENEPISTGTAFCIHPDGLFLTAAHVVQGTEWLKIRTEKGVVPAKVVSSDEGLDIALLKAVDNGFTAISLLSSSAVKIGDKVFTIGFPNIGVQGSEAKFTDGVISSLSGVQNNPRFFQISVAIQPGNSGGPLVDEKGRVIGIINAKLNDMAALVVTGSVPQNVNYAVKSSFVLPLLEGVEGLKEMPKPTELSREEAIQKAKSAVGLVLCY